MTSDGTPPPPRPSWYVLQNAMRVIGKRYGVTVKLELRTDVKRINGWVAWSVTACAYSRAHCHTDSLIAVVGVHVSTEGRQDICGAALQAVSGLEDVLRARQAERATQAPLLGIDEL